MSRPISIDGYWRVACAGKKTKSDRRYFRWGGRVLIVPVGTIIIWAMGLALVWLLDELFSILTFLSTASILLAFLVVLPLAMPKPTRAFSSAALGIFSYLFGATLLADSVLVDAAAWRGVAVIVGGVFGFGVLIVLMPKLATLLAMLLDCQWQRFCGLLFLGVLGFGISIVPMALLETLLHCQWQRFCGLLFLGILFVGSRLGWLAIGRHCDLSGPHFGWRASL